MFESKIFGLVLFAVGIGLLTWCAKVERKELARMRDPVEKWAYIDGKREDEIKKRAIRSLVITVVGSILALYGFFNFLSNLV